MRVIPIRVAMTVARQLALPTGPFGQVVLPLLDRVNSALMDGAAEVLSPNPWDRVADIGCGGGRGVRRLLELVGPSGRVHAVDPSPIVVNRMRRSHRDDIAAGRLIVQRASMDELPHEEDTLDGVLTTNTVYYIDHLARALREVHRVLRSGGTLVVGVGDPEFMARLPIAGHGPILRPIDDVVDTMSNAGFAVDSRVRLDNTADAFHVLAATKL